MSKLIKLTAEQKTFIPYGIGAGVGVLVPIILKKFVDGNTPYPSFWQKPSVYIPIVTGVGAIILAQYTKYIKDQKTKKAMVLYGITASLAGILAGIYGTSLTARAQTAQAASLGCPTCEQKAQYQNMRNSGGYTNLGWDGKIPNPPDYMSTTYPPNFQGNFWNRYDTRAKGWGMDVTRNPKAALPTQIFPGEIRA